MSDPRTPQTWRGMPASLELARADLGFSAAHFSTVGGVAERLHGHNYRVSLRVHGSIESDGSIVDFRVLKHALRAECNDLDEHMLVPALCDTLTIESSDDGIEVREAQRRYVFPRDDVRLLPIPNTTCECLAAYLLTALRTRLGTLPVRLEVHVEEVPGQGATVKE